MKTTIIIWEEREFCWEKDKSGKSKQYVFKTDIQDEIWSQQLLITNWLQENIRECKQRNTQLQFQLYVCTANG